VKPSVAAPGDTNPSDATDLKTDCNHFTVWKTVRTAGWGLQVLQHL